MFRAKACAVFSISAFDMPMALTGCTALSVPRQTTDRTPLALAASRTLEEPITLVCTACMREELAGGHLLERGSMEDQVHAAGGLVDAGVVADVAEEELDPRVVERNAHLVLLEFVTAQHPNLVDARGQESTDHGGAEGPGATGHQDGACGHARSTRLGS